MAQDYQSLLSNDDVAGYRAFAQPTTVQLLKLALLRSIAKTSSPMTATDYQSLISSPNVAGYRAAGATSESQLLELALLQIISGISGGSSLVIAGNYAGGQPNFTPSSAAAVAIDSSNGRVWWYFNSAWN